jgi:hypothetical protein
MTDNWWSEKLTWAFSSGELKTTCYQPKCVYLLGLQQRTWLWNVYLEIWNSQRIVQTGLFDYSPYLFLKYLFKKFHTKQSKVDTNNWFLKIGKKSLGSGVKTRVGRVTRTTHIFLFGLTCSKKELHTSEYKQDFNFLKWWLINNSFVYFYEEHCFKTYFGI